MILIGTDEGIYRWVDECGWPIYHALQDRAVVRLASSWPGVIVAVDRAGTVLETTNGGLDWRTIPPPASSGRPVALAICGQPPAIIMATRPMSLHQRVVGLPVARDPARNGRTRISDLARALVETAVGWIGVHTPPSSDSEADPLGGWLPLNAPNVPRGPLPPEIRSLTPLPGESGAWLAAAVGAGLWRSVDQGRTWEACPGMPAEVHAVRVVPNQPRIVWAATDEGVRQSTDAGLTWTDRSAGLESSRQVRAIAVRPDNPKIMLAGAAPAPPDPRAAPRHGLDFSLYESADAGQKWTRVAKGNLPESFDFDTISDIAFDPASPDNTIVALGSGELWLTKNAGAYWEPLARQLKAARVLCGVA